MGFLCFPSTRNKSWLYFLSIVWLFSLLQEESPVLRGLWNASTGVHEVLANVFKPPIF